jgi:Arc/MetJ-type ribon-helix-helix transcriptional regulator
MTAPAHLTSAADFIRAALEEVRFAQAAKVPKDAAARDRWWRQSESVGKAAVELENALRHLERAQEEGETL